LAPPDKPDYSTTPCPAPKKHDNNASEVKAEEQVASPSLDLKLGALGDYLSEENMERLGRGARAFAGHGTARAEKFVKEDLQNLTELANGARRDAKAELERKIAEMHPKAKQLGAEANAKLVRAQTEAAKLAVTSKGHWQNFNKLLKKYRFAILVGLVSLAFIATGHPEYILYALLHLVMFVFALVYTIIGTGELIFDNLLGIELFSFIGDAFYNVIYAFYAPAYYTTNTVVIWLQWIHIFRPS
jgi:hypothetical protein